MSDTAHTTRDHAATKRPRPILVRLLRVLAFSGLALVLLLAALIGFSETQTFRSMLRDVIVEAADSSLNARLSIASIEGNLFAGWKISGVRLDDASGPVADIESIVLRYNIFRLPWKRVTINELTINGPRFHITKAAGRDWNVATLIRPSDDDDSTSTPFDWVIAVENLRIVDGMLLVYDSTVTEPLRRDRLDTRRMRLEKFDLALSAVIRSDHQAVRLNQCSWSNPFGDVALENLAGDLSLRPGGVDVRGLSVQTSHTSFILTAGVEQVDLFGELDTEALKRMRMHVLLDAPAVEARDLQYFLPSLEILGGGAELRLAARGTLDRLRIERLDLGTGESSLEFRGTLSHILEGTGMHIAVESEETVIRAIDVAEILPGIPIPDLTEMGTVRFSKLAFDGQPLRFEAEMDMQSDAGDAAGRIALDLRGEDLVYDGSIRTHRLDLSKVLRDPQLRSAINLDGTVKGRGTRLGSMTARLRLRADSTRYQRLVANELELAADVRPDSLHFDLRSTMGPSRLLAEGAMSFQPDSITGIRLRTDARKLDLATILDDDALASDLNFSLQASADGIDLATATGDVEMVFAPSQLADLRIDADTFRLQLVQNPGKAEYLLLQSQYADARIDGRFDLPRLAAHAAAQIDSLAAAFASYTVTPDTLRAAADVPSRRGRQDRGGRVAPSARAPNARVPLPETQDTAAFMDARYTLTLKNPDRVARYFNASTFLVRGTWRGGIRGGVRGLDVDGELALSDFYLVDTARTWLAAGVRCTYDIQDLKLQNVLGDLAMNLRISAADLNINGLRLSRTQLQLDWAGGAPSLRVRGLVDTLAQVDLQMEARYADHGFDITAPRLEVMYRDRPLRNRDPIVLRLDSGGIALRAFDIGDEAMRLAAHGIRDREGMNDFTVYADSVNISDLEYLLTGDPAAREGSSFAGIGFLEATFRGSDAEPMLAADVFIDRLGYRGAHFGEMVLEARYDRRVLEVYSELSYASTDENDEKVLFISGSIPLAISFGEGEEEPDRDASANLRMQLREFPLALIEEFLGLFSPLNGVANGDFTVTGTASDPSFNGFLAVSDARGRFIFNNIEYDLGLRIEALDRDIRIVDLSVANLPSDWREGRMSASGMISTEAFSVKKFDLAVRGRLKVLKFASRSAIRTIYGDLYISTGAEDLTYGGRLDRSMLRGDIIVEQGELVFPLEQSAGAVNKYADINYIVVDDTTRRVTSSLSSSRFARLTKAASEEETIVRLPGRSVLDGLGFALTLSTAGRLRLEIPFSVLQEELNAELVVNNLQVNNFGGSGVKFVGEVTLGQDSYFIFLGKRMTATGTIRFTRDPLNPDLDLTAVYSDYYIDPRTQVRRPVFVTVRITGTKNVMKLDYELRWDSADGEQVTSSGDVKSDVVSFLVFGVFTRDLSSSEGDRSSIAEKSPEFLNQITSSIASSAATEFLNQAGLTEFIRRVDFAGLGTQDSRVKLTSEIGRAIITYDGKINDLESSNMSVDFPLSRVLGIPWTNLMVQVSRKTLNESFESTSQSQQYSVWELKILQRFSF